MIPRSTSLLPPRMEKLGATSQADRKSTRLNSSHPSISYAVFCLKKKNSKILYLRPALSPGKMLNVTALVLFLLITTATLLLVRQVDRTRYAWQSSHAAIIVLLRF